MSLLEVLVAGALLSIGLTALASSIPMVTRIIADVRDLSAADRVTAAFTEQLVMTWAADPTRVPATGTVQADDAGRESSAGRFAVSWRHKVDILPTHELTELFVATANVDDKDHRT